MQKFRLLAALVLALVIGTLMPADTSAAKGTTIDMSVATQVAADARELGEFLAPAMLNSEGYGPCQAWSDFEVYSSPQAAIDAAPQGEAVYVLLRSNTYCDEAFSRGGTTQVVHNLGKQVLVLCGIEALLAGLDFSKLDRTNGCVFSGRRQNRIAVLKGPEVTTWDKPEVWFMNISFVDGNAGSGPADVGGAIYADNVSLAVYMANFVNNVANRGGAIFGYRLYGGVGFSTLINNQAQEGAAFLCNACEGALAFNNRFLRNGGPAVSDTTGAALSFSEGTNLQALNNVIAHSPLAIRGFNAKIEGANNTIVDNAYGIVLRQEAPYDFQSGWGIGIIANNNVGVQATGADVVFTHINWWENTTNIVSTTSVISRTHERFGDVRFVNRPALDYALQEGSAACDWLDMGHPNFDINMRSRISSRTRGVDGGAFESCQNSTYVPSAGRQSSFEPAQPADFPDLPEPPLFDFLTDFKKEWDEQIKKSFGGWEAQVYSLQQALKN